MAAVHGIEWLGYGRTESMIADLIDVQIRIAAGKKWRKSMLYPRPAVKKVAGGRSLRAFVPRRVSNG